MVLVAPRATTRARRRTRRKRSARDCHQPRLRVHSELFASLCVLLVYRKVSTGVVATGGAAASAHLHVGAARVPISCDHTSDETPNASSQKGRRREVGAAGGDGHHCRRRRRAARLGGDPC